MLPLIHGLPSVTRTGRQGRVLRGRQVRRALRTASESHLTCQTEAQLSHVAADRGEAGSRGRAGSLGKDSASLQGLFLASCEVTFTVVSASLQPAASVQPLVSVYEPKRAPGLHFSSLITARGCDRKESESTAAINQQDRVTAVGSQNRAGQS